MTVFLIVMGVLAALAIGVVIALYCVRMDRMLVARADIRARQRQAEAEMQHVVQQTIQRMFDAARRPPLRGDGDVDL